MVVSRSVSIVGSLAAGVERGVASCPRARGETTRRATKTLTAMTDVRIMAHLLSGG
jgi:hypothetical protein